MSVAERSGLALAANVLGVGALFLPWTVTASFGPAALIGWGYHLLAGGLLVATLANLASAGGTGGGAVGLIGTALGELPGKVIRACYVIGITAGQAVVSLVAAGFAVQALGLATAGNAARATAWIAAGLLAMSAALAWRQLTVAALVLLGVEVVLLAATVLVAATAKEVASAGPTLSASTIGGAVAIQCFAVVGWESAARPAATRPASEAGRARWLGPLGGVFVVGLLYGSVLVAARTMATDHAAPGLALPVLSGSGAGRAVAAAMALVAGLFCARNIRTAAVLAMGLADAELRPRALVATAAALAAVATVGVALVGTGRLTATAVLTVPNAMACAVFLLAGVAAMTAGRQRLLAGMAVVAYLPVVGFLGALAFVPPAAGASSALPRLRRGWRQRMGNQPEPGATGGFAEMDGE